MIDLARHCRRDRRIRRMVQIWDETPLGKRTQRSLAEGAGALVSRKLSFWQ